MQFRALVRHFFGRFFDQESTSTDADPAGRLIQLLALLSIPGLMIPVFAPNSGNDPYLFVSNGTIVMGLLMAYKWDMLFPDRRDYLILTALPISTKQWFAAKAVALGAFLLLFVVAVNFFSMLFTPPLMAARSGAVHFSGYLRALAAHASGTLGGSLFAVLFFGALQGVLINVLSPDAFRRISARIQMISIASLVTLLMLTPWIKVIIPHLAKANSPVLDYFPLVWFLGLYESLLPGGTALPKAHLWARTAVYAMLLTGLAFVVSYLIGYRRYSRKILESVETDRLATRMSGCECKRDSAQPLNEWSQPFVTGVLNRTVLRNPIQRAAFYFIGKISARSAKHRHLAALFTGLGVALTVSSLFVFDSRSAFPVRLSAWGPLEAPLILSFVAVAGLRAAFNVPHELNANWIFQTGTGGGAEYVKAVRKWILLCRIVPLYAMLVPFQFVVFDARTAVFHLIFDLVVTAFLIEAFFFRFNKVPFTCAFLSRKIQLAVAAAGYLYLFTIFIGIAGRLKYYVVAEPGRLAAFLAATAALFAAISTYRRHRHDRKLRIVYEEPDSAIQQLNLS